MQPLRIAVTGTPGTGKTTFCSGLDYPIISVLDLAIETNTIVQDDMDSEVIEIDVELLNKKLSEKWDSPPKNTIFIDGHLSHHLPVDRIVLLRCRPDILEERLKKRNWPENKILENKEFELLSAVINELDECIITLELNNSSNSMEYLRQQLIHWLKNDKESRMLNLDWIGELNP